MTRTTAGSRGTGWKHVARAVLCAGLLALTSACAGISPHPVESERIPPLTLDGGRTLYPADVDSLIDTPDLLELNDEMRDFVRRYTSRLPRERQRLSMLHNAIKSPSMLGIEYEPYAEGTAVETFNRGRANCLSFASLFVAMAREADLNAHYQWLEIRPQWSRLGERVAVRLHVNVLVAAEGGQRFQVDIDPVTSGDIAGARTLTDRDAEALYHSNIAMTELAAGRLDEAWLHLVRAIQRSPQMSHLWVNLGAVYRQAGQVDDAERSYLYALELDGDERSAMTNLMVLYQAEGREAERDRWEAEVRRYRDRNPYFHAWLGEQAAEQDDWQGALEHMERAIRLSPQESHLLYSAGVMHYELGNLSTARDYISQAIENATLINQREDYRVKLDAIRRAGEGGG
jgi:Flp pilus assembly protein TadD